MDGTKELSNNAIREQLTDWPDLEVAMDIAPPTRQLMQWKESGGVDTLFSHLCGVIIHPQLLQVLIRINPVRNQLSLSRLGSGCNPCLCSCTPRMCSEGKHIQLLVKLIKK